MGRDIDYRDTRTGQNRLVVGGYPSFGIERVASRGRLRKSRVGHGKDLVTSFLVSVEMRNSGASGADQPDARPIGERVARPVGQIRGGGCGSLFDNQRVTVLIEGVAAYGATSTVRRSTAERTAASTIRWPIRASLGSSGPAMASPVSLQ
jgi:hypothetical protein